MNKNKKIAIGIISGVILIIVAAILISILSAGPSAEMSGITYHVGDKINFNSFNNELNIETYIYSISEEAMYSRTSDGKYTVMWDLKKGSGMLVDFPDEYLY